MHRSDPQCHTQLGSGTTVERNTVVVSVQIDPLHPYNQDVAVARGLRYNTEMGNYEDVDGCQIRDEYGQPL